MPAQIQSLFPTPVVTNKFASSFVEKEKEFIQSHADKVIKSTFNNISKDKYISEVQMLRMLSDGTWI